MPDPTPILFTIPNFISAGSGRAMLNVIERLDRTRFAPAVCVRQKGGALDREVERLGIPFLEAPFTVPAQPYASLAQRAWRAAQVFRPYHFAFWHSYNYADDYTEPLIARLSGAGAWVFTKKNMGWGSNAWRLRSLLASRIAAQNTDMMREFFDGWPLRGRTRLVPCGVVTDSFAIGSVPSLGVRERLGIPRDAVVAGCVAHLVPLKGHRTLIDAVADVPDLHLLVAGRPADAAYAAELERRVVEGGLTGRVHFLGDVREVAALLTEVDIAVLPTAATGEGSPVALMESLAMGRACIATEVPGSRDQIRHGENGLLVRPGDRAALAAALRELAGSAALRERLGAAARQTVLDRYRIEREVADYTAIYHELVAS